MAVTDNIVIAGQTFSPYYQYINATGIIVPDTSEIQRMVEAEWQNAFGDSISVNPSTPQGIMIAMSVTARKGVLETCALTANQLNLDTATGQFLDAHGSLFTLERIPASPSEVECTLTGVPGTTIEAGSQVRSTSGDLFESRTTAIIGGTNGGNSVNVTFYSVEAGPIPISPGSITSIATPVSGWETVSVTSADGCIIGRDVERDNEFRARIRDSRYSGLSMLASIRAKLNTISDISGYALYNNPTGANLTIDNEDGTPSSVVLVPHSICLIVKSAATTGLQDSIANQLFHSVPVGCDYTGLTGNSITRNVYDYANGRPVAYPITFNVANPVLLDCIIKVKRNTYGGDGLAETIKSAIETWAAGEVPGVDGISVGMAISPFEISCGVSAQIPEIIISEVMLGLHGGTSSGYTPIAIDAGSIPSISDIAVVIDGSTTTFTE